MRLHKHLNESSKTLDDLIEDSGMMPWPELEKILKKDCSKYINEVKQDRVLWRGTKDLSPFTSDITKLRPLMDRHPKDTGRAWTEAADAYFMKNFGWKPRTQGMFAIKRFSYAQDYGTPFLFFPIGNYKYVWSPNSDDFYTVSTGSRGHADPDDEEDFTAFMDELVWKDKNLKFAMSDVEITFGVNSYYMVHMVYWQHIYDMLGMSYDDANTITRKVYGALG